MIYCYPKAVTIDIMRYGRQRSYFFGPIRLGNQPSLEIVLVKRLPILMQYSFKRFIKL